MNRKRIALAAGLILASPVSVAAVSDADFQVLTAKVATLTQALADMQRERAEERAQAAAIATQAAAAPVVAKAAATPSATSWAEKVKINGDFRYRHEQLDIEDEAYRLRHRIRARLGLTAAVADSVTVGFGLASGTGGDPVSANESLDGGFRDKGINLDLAYFDWTAMPGTHVIGGKFRNPFYRPGDFAMVWDDDLRPEGVAATYDNGMLFGTVAALWVEESATSNNDVGIFGIQGSVRFNVADDAKITAGAGYFDASDVKGKAFLFDVGNSFGNTAGPDDTYLYGYKELEGFVELALKAFGQPVRIFADYVQNTDADNLDTGWGSGIIIGEAKARGTWSVGYAYMDLDADAVLGVFTDSDFGENGTDRKGHMVQGIYALTDRANFRAIYYMTERGISTNATTDINRLMLDVNFKY